MNIMFHYNRIHWFMAFNDARTILEVCRLLRCRRLIVSFLSADELPGSRRPAIIQPSLKNIQSLGTTTPLTFTLHCTLWRSSTAIITSTNIRLFYDVLWWGILAYQLLVSVLLLRLVFSTIHCFMFFIYYFLFFKFFLSLSLSLLYFFQQYSVLCLCSLTVFDCQEIKSLLTYLLIYLHCFFCFVHMEKTIQLDPRLPDHFREDYSDMTCGTIITVVITICRLHRAYAESCDSLVNNYMYIDKRYKIR